jgi:hypothetical protein
MKRPAITATAALAIVLLLAGCSSSSGSSSPDRAAPGAPSPLTDKSATGESSDGGIAADAQVITTGWVSIRVDDPAKSSADAVATVEKHDGRIDNRSEQSATDSQDASAQLTIRVPQDQITDTLDELKKLGTVENVSISETDVTAQTTDLDARITAMQASVDRLLGLMSTATNIDDLVALESALSTRQADLDSLTSQRKALGDQVDYSTIELQLYTAGSVPSGGPKDFWGGLVVGWNSLLSTLSGTLVVLGVALPWLLVLAVLGAVALLVVRVSTRQRGLKVPPPSSSE